MYIKVINAFKVPTVAKYLIEKTTTQQLISKPF